MNNNKHPMLLTVESPNAMSAEQREAVKQTVREDLAGTALEGAAIVVVGNGMRVNLTTVPPHVSL